VAKIVKETSAENVVETDKAAKQTADNVAKVEEKNRLAREKAEEENTKNAQTHLEKIHEASHKTRGAEIQAEFENRTAAENAASDHAAAVAEVEAKNADTKAVAARKHADKVQTVEAANAAKQAEFDAATAKRNEVLNAVEQQTTRRGQLARQVNARAARMIERLKRIKAEWKDSAALQKSKGYTPTGKLDVMYERLRKATAGASVPRMQLADAVLDSEGLIKGSDENIKIFRDILTKAVEEDSEQIMGRAGKQQAGHSLAQVVGDVDREGMEEATPADFSELQGYYTELGEKLAPGTLPPDVYQAMRNLQDKIGGMMQKIATEKGVGSLFRQAQRGYRDYMETFRESRGPNHSGSPISQALDAADPAYAIQPLMDAETAPRVRNALARFDPARNGAGGAAQLFDNFRKTVQDFDATGTKIKVPREPKSPRLGKTPEYTEPPLQEPPKPTDPSVKLPERTAPPDRPKPVQATITPPPEPTQPELQTQTPETLSAAKAENVSKAADRMRHSKSPLANAVAGYGTIKALLVRNLATAGLDITARLLYGAAKPVLADLIENPRVVKELAKFTDADAAAIQKLPADQQAAFKDTMGMIAKGAKAKGIKVSGALLAAVGASGGEEQRKKALNTTMTISPPPRPSL
jgi:hypothetical protein